MKPIEPVIYDSITDAIGGTPMVRLSRIARDVPCELVAKCEYLNPGGSVKDRIGIRMIEDAEREGRIKPGDTLIEPTSGNTGIGLALAAATKGYRVIVTMPEKMSTEKQLVLEALGAEIIRTPTEAAWDSDESHISVAKRLTELIPGSHILDQYGNSSNPYVHAETTAREIIEQTGGKLDAVVIGTGTGGTITGVAKTIKDELPHVRIVGVDPEGSILAGPGEVKSYKVEGIGYDFIPNVLQREVVDEWVKCNDRDSFRVARQLIRQEGLLCGGSSGSAVWGALKVARDMRPEQRVVVILPDSLRNYMTKFLDDTWMRQHGFAQADWEMETVGDMLRALPPRQLITANVTERLGAVVDRFKEHGISQMPVLDEGKLAGILTESDVLQHLVTGHAKRETSVAEVMVRRVHTIPMHASASELPKLFEKGEVAVLRDDVGHVAGLITKMDLIDLLAAGHQHAS